MKAIVITEPGDPGVLQLQEIEEPEVSANQVLVRIRATALNRADLLQRRGLYRPAGSQRGDIAGLEFAGEVESVGQRVGKWQAGDRVMGILAGHGYAEKAAVPEGMLLSIPDHLS
ncbi:MAG: alcohol dehydrogenase catalytic domain-containing protein, partial [Acidobacteriota bacterium]